MQLDFPFAGRFGDNARPFGEVRGLDAVQSIYRRFPDGERIQAAEQERLRMYAEVSSLARIVVEVEARPKLIGAAERQHLFERCGAELSDCARKSGNWIDMLLGDVSGKGGIVRSFGRENFAALLETREKGQTAFSKYTLAMALAAQAASRGHAGSVEAEFQRPGTIDGVTAGRVFLLALGEERDILERVRAQTKIAMPKLELHRPQSGRTIKPYQRIAADICKAMIGNEDGILAVAAAVADHLRADPEDIKPLVILLPGPTGTGKTMLAGLLAKALKADLYKFNMAEFGQSHAISKLIGSPPGYIGSNDGGRLVNGLREAHLAKHDEMIILFDEVEKAHPAIWQSLLGFFDKGEVSDTNGPVKIPKKTVVIMTTNLLSEEFSTKAEALHSGRVAAKDVLAQNTFFSPEFIGRISDVVPLFPLGPEEYQELVKRTLHDIGRQRGMELTIHDDQLEMLANEVRDAYDQSGTRGIQYDLTTIVRNLVLNLDHVPRRMRLDVSLDGYRLKPHVHDVKPSLLQRLRTFTSSDRKAMASAVDEAADVPYDAGIEEVMLLDPATEPEVASVLQSACEGAPDAQLLVARAFMQGTFLPENSERGLHWLQLAAEGGSVDAQMDLAYCYDCGYLVKCDLKEAQNWYKRAAENGNVIAMTHSGYLALRGPVISEKDASRFLNEAAKKGVMRAYHLRADRAIRDATEDARYAAALPDLQTAREGGYVASIATLRAMHEQGLGVPKNSVEAFKLTVEEAATGCYDASLHLAKLYRNGQGIGPNATEALRIYSNVIANGNRKQRLTAHVRAGDIERSNADRLPKISDRAECKERAIDHFRKAVELGWDKEKATAALAELDGNIAA